MVSPQCENGYLRIANEIMEALARTRIPGEARQVLDVIFRKTYGFNKKQDQISLSQFCLYTGIKKPNCIRAINKAKVMNIIIQRDNGKYLFNKNYDQWLPLPKQKARGKALSKKIIVIRKDNKSLSEAIPTKDIYTKDKSQGLPYKLSNLLFQEILKNNSNSRLHNLTKQERGKKLHLWAEDIEKLIHIDKQEASTIEEVIKWCQNNDFWRSNILSGRKLREKWDQLTAKMQKQKREVPSTSYQEPDVFKKAKEAGIEF